MWKLCVFSLRSPGELWLKERVAAFDSGNRRKRKEARLRWDKQGSKVSTSWKPFNSPFLFFGWGRRCFSSKLWILWWLSTSSFQVPSLKCIGFGRVPGVCEAKLTLWHGGLKMQIHVRQFGRGRSWLMEEDPNKIDGWHNTQERERERGREMDLCIPLLHKHHTTCPYHIIFITSLPHQFVHSI